MKASVAISSISLTSGNLFSFEAEISSKIISSTPLSLKILTVFIGSPIYLGSSNFNVLTKPLFLSSKTGIILVMYIIMFRVFCVFRC
ncbi:MAG: hypothetical protein ACD_79C01439G0001 [uncultured bacterium]|nr:MAG: hypothetical protein ACD_79C01439G0001 [uncultured bacterium]